MSENKIFKQSLGLFGSSLLLVAIGFGIKYIQTHALGDIDYGEYAFFSGFTMFLALFFRFGFFSSIQVLLANNYNMDREKRILGAGYLIALVNGLLMVITLWIASFLVNDFFNSSIGDILKIMSPLTFIIPFDSLIGAYATGTNRIKIFSYFRFVPKLIYLIIILAYHYFIGLDLFHAIFLNLTVSILYGILLLVHLNPSFRDLRSSFVLIWNKNKKYGIHEYTGSVLGQATYNMDQLFISHYIGTVQLGFYSLALLICTPMVMLSQAVSRSIFRSYSKRSFIPKKIFQYNFLWLSVSVIFLAIFGKLIVSLFFGDEFRIVGTYILPMAAVFFVHGLYIPYSFLEAKSRGKELRNAKILEAVINITGNIILIPIYHIYGAIITSFIAKLVHYLMIRYYYHQYLQSEGITATS